VITVHLTEADLARDVHAVLDKVRHGMEVVIDDDSCAVAVISAPQARGTSKLFDDQANATRRQEWDPAPWE
jgi:hypothetical protein